MSNYDVYSAWEVRTGYPLTETFNQAKERIAREAERMNIEVRWRKGRGQSRFKDPRFHFWEIKDETNAMMFMLAFGDRINSKCYPVEGK